MIPLLFLMLFAEGMVALLLMVKVGPLQELAMRGVDQVKTSKGSVTVKTLACTLSIILMSNVASILKIQNRGLKLGTVSPMDQVLWRTHLHEASLIAMVESLLRQRLLSPLSCNSGNGDFEVRHLRLAKRASGSGGGGMRGRWAPPEIEIPDTNCLYTASASEHGYTSLRDIISSSPKDNSPDEPPGGAGAVAGDVHMIRHPLVKHAAYAYLQLTPSAQEEARRRMLQRRRDTICRIFLGCLGFLGALFGHGR